MNKRSSVVGILAAQATLAGMLSGPEVSRRKQPFVGLAPPRTQGRETGLVEPPKPKLTTKMVRSGSPLSLRKRKKLLTRIQRKR